MAVSIIVSLALCFLSTPLQALESVMQKRSDDPQPLQAVVDSLAHQVAASNAKLAAYETATKAKIAKLEADLAKARTRVAFHAEFSKSNVTLGPSSPLILDRVVTNVGNAYDAHTGNFEAPVSGNYMFVLNFMGDYHTSTYLYLMVEDSVRDMSLSHGDGTTWDHVSASLVKHLAKGQRVWLRSDSRASKVYKGNHYTTFAGFLIDADP